ncbi:MAG: hypothetical protein ACRD50_12055 [Candidatus Acidiferrales bacterium]
MNRLLGLLLLVLWLLVGWVLIVAPWSGYWESNVILSRFPSLIPVLLNPYFRGAVTGLGVVDAVLATEAFRRKLVTLATKS